MKDLIEDLIALIRREENILGLFLDCLNRQKEFIVQNKSDEFDQTVREEEELIAQVRQLEQERMALVKSISNAAGSKEDELSLTRLIELNLGESSDELKKMKRVLAGLVERIKRANRVNQYLIQRSLSFIQKNIDWFIDDGNLNVIYGRDGNQKVKEASNLLVDRIL